ncbi:hypothetical protein NIES39_B00880 [Arthrospira platensis NIES-39]|nr:hypothetical protein NIES39_B00880 [Arthrospira platensis NIES-39]
MLRLVDFKYGYKKSFLAYLTNSLSFLCSTQKLAQCVTTVKGLTFIYNDSH